MIEAQPPNVRSDAEALGARSGVESDDLLALAVFQQMSDGVLVLSREGVILSANPAFCKIHALNNGGRPCGYFESLSEMVEMRTPAGDLLPKERWPFSRTLNGEPLVREELRVSRRDGTYTMIGEFTSVLVGAQGAEKVVITVRDVTSEVLAREAASRLQAELLVARTRLDAMLSAAEIGTWTYNVIHDSVSADRNLAMMYGFCPDEAECTNVATYFDRIHIEDRAMVSERLREALDGGDRYEAEYRLTVPGQPERTVIARGIVERDEEGHPVAMPGVVVDVSRRAAAERALVDSERLQRLVFDTVPACISYLDRDARYVITNATVVKWFGRPAKRIVGKTIRDLIGDESYAYRQPYVERVLKGEFVEFESPVKLPNGRIIDGLSHYVPDIRDGEVVGFVAMVQDVTAHRETERALRRSEQELEEKVKERTRELEEANREMEGFTYSIAHDLRAPLRSISATSRMLIEEVGDTLDEGQRRLLDRQAQSSVKLARLIDDLLALTRIGRHELRRTDLDLSKLCEEVTHSLGNGWRTIDIEEGLRACADPSLLRIAVQNLLDNACKYCPEGGAVRVGVRTDGGESVYFVSDDGIGLEMQYAQKIFEPFERLHRDDQYPGTGVGLASVRRVMERHGGRVWAESEGLGKGTTFCFTLPKGRKSRR